MLGRTIKINFVDFYESFNKNDNFLLDALRRNFNVVIDDNNPDYLFCSCFGYSHYKYTDAVKIFFSGENVGCDYNLYDYAIDFDYIDYGDRHLRYPLHTIYNCDRERRKLSANEALNRKFCNFCYSNSVDACRERTDFFYRLSEYKHIDSGGRYLNNIGAPVDDKLAFIADYKFTIAFENSSKSGYVTEKILDPFYAGSVPIYWGDPNVVRDFNPKAFINAFDFATLDELIAEVKHIDNDESAYIEMLNAPIYNNGENYKETANAKLTDFLTNIVNQPIEKAKRRTEFGFTRRKMRDNYYLAKSDNDIIPKYLKKILFFYYRHFGDAEKWNF